jgi:anti-sigma regulatory factor (Ser/Thr protein kinase)
MARRAIAKGLSDCPEDVVDKVVLLVSELVTNSVLHAGLGPGDSVKVSMRVRPDRIHVEVIDTGPGFGSNALHPNPSEGQSLGLYLVDWLSDRWGMSNQPCSVWFDVATPPDSSDGDSRPRP